MRGWWVIMRGGLGLAALGVGLVAAGCLSAQPAPPPAPAQLSVSPSLVQFPSTPPPYSYMPNESITVTNTGGHTADSVAVTGVGVYSVPSTTCSTLAAGQSCTADIQFCPSTSGTYTNTLQVTGTDAVTGAPLEASTTLQGTATT